MIYMCFVLSEMGSRCIGGVGVFLIITGYGLFLTPNHHLTHALYSWTSRFTVCTRMSDDDFDLSLTTFKFLFLDAYNLALWLPPFALAVILRIITHKYHHQLIFPLCTFLLSPFSIGPSMTRADMPRFR